jgi:phenylpropionate dioxygenase-like ring-hydroxylating dioxygenase large terminal subunit
VGVALGGAHLCSLPCALRVAGFEEALPMTRAAHAAACSTTLPREYYVSDEIFEREIEQVFFRQWTFAAHESELAGPGEFVVCELAGESVVVVRDAVGDVRAFFNVCRHRGYRFCEPSEGRSTRFTCPYHQWSYGLDGRLLHAPGSHDGELFDYGDWGLVPAHVEVWHGLVFVALGDEAPPPLAPVLDLYGAGMVAARPERLTRAFRETYEVEANWKLLLENYLECYHCRARHPELCSSMALDAMYATTAGWSGPHMGGSTPLKPDRATMSLDGRLVSKPLGDFADLDELTGGLGGGFMIVPLLTRLICHVDHMIVHLLRPVDARRTRWETRWYVHADAVEGVDYDVEALTGVWRATNRQDVGLCERTQLGVSSRRFVPGPLHPERESALRSALDTYLELMGEPPVG